jgi:hypothetical protein
MPATEPPERPTFTKRGGGPSAEEAQKAALRSSDEAMHAVPPGRRLLTVYCSWHLDTVVAVLTTSELLTTTARVPYPDHSVPVYAPCGECVAVTPHIWQMDMRLLREAHRRVEAAVRAKSVEERGGPLRRLSAIDLLPEAVKAVLLRSHLGPSSVRSGRRAER